MSLVYWFCALVIVGGCIEIWWEHRKLDRFVEDYIKNNQSRFDAAYAMVLESNEKIERASGPL